MEPNNWYIDTQRFLQDIFGEQADDDLHIKNIGRKNGKLIAIDFGTASELWC